MGRKTPGAALTDWIHQMAAGRRTAACQDMGRPGFSGQQSMAICMSAKAKPEFTAEHRAFATYGIRPSTPVSVVAAHVTGTKAIASAKDVHVSGTTLYSLMMAHSTGVKPGQFTVTFQLARIQGNWYVSGMNIGGGTSVNIGS